MLLDGTKVQGPAALRQALLAQKEQFVKTVTAKLATYALGREIEYSDETAIRDYTDALAQENGQAPTWKRRGLCYARLGLFDRAVADLARALEIAPRDAEAHFERGKLLEARGEFNPALNDYTEAGRLDPTGPGRAAKAALQQKRGAIVNTASVAGLVATPGMPAYVASKHAVIGLTKTAAGEVARQGIRVNAVCPGPVDTRMIHSLEAQLNPADPASVGRRYQSVIPIGRYVTPDEIANTVLFLCSDLASAITGAQYVVDGARTATGGAVTQAMQS